MSALQWDEKTAEQAEQLKESFEDQGYVILKGILSSETVSAFIEAVKLLVDQVADELVETKKINDPLQHEPFETRMYQLYKDHLDLSQKRFKQELHVKGMFPMFFNPDVLDIVETWLGPEIRLYPNYTVRMKYPEWKGTQVLWHQDAGYTRTDEQNPVENLRMVNVWSPLVPAHVHNGCMQFIPGTHKLGIVPHTSKEYYLEIVQEYLEPRLKDAVDIILDPGDIVLFSNLLFHQGLPNLSDHIRWSADWRYQDATQSTTNRAQQGHMARSRRNPELVVKSGEQWESLTFR